MDDILVLLGDAAQAHQWVPLAILAVVLVVPVVSKALGKKVPLVDTVASWLVSVAKSLMAAKKAEAEKAQPGVAAVVEVKDAVDVKRDMVKDDLK